MTIESGYIRLTGSVIDSSSGDEVKKFNIRYICGKGMTFSAIEITEKDIADQYKAVGLYTGNQPGTPWIYLENRYGDMTEDKVASYQMSVNTDDYKDGEVILAQILECEVDNVEDQGSNYYVKASNPGIDYSIFIRKDDKKITSIGYTKTDTDENMEGERIPSMIKMTHHLRAW